MFSLKSTTLYGQTTLFGLTKQSIQQWRKILLSLDSQKKEKKSDFTVGGLRYVFFQKKSSHSRYNLFKSDESLDYTSILRFDPVSRRKEDSYTGSARDIVYIIRVADGLILYRSTVQKYYEKREKQKVGTLISGNHKDVRETFIKSDILSGSCTLKTEEEILRQYAKKYDWQA